MSTSPTQRTLKALRNMGLTVDICERWIRNPKHPAGGFRKDMFGFLDLVALSDTEIIGVQSCGQSFKAHIDKIMSDELREDVLRWLSVARLECWGWRKIKLRRGGKALRWRPRVAVFWIGDGMVIWREEDLE